jgi:hypothetical protein
MSTLPTGHEVRARRVRITRDALIVTLADGRTVAVPLAWFPKLLHGSARQRRDWELLGDGEGIRWPALDEDLSVAGLLRGTPVPPAAVRAGRRRNAVRKGRPGPRAPRRRAPRKASARRG